jgi:hypothetical protein
VRCSRVPWPTPQALDAAPELGLLAALEATLELSLRALVAAHPALADRERPAWALDRSPRCVAAHRFVDRAAALLQALDAYRATFPAPPTPPSVPLNS